LISYFDGHSPRNSSLSPYLCVSYLCMSWAFPSGNYSLYFLLEYIHFIWRSHCDNSKQAYIVHCLDHPHHLSPSTPPCPTSSNSKRFHCSMSYRYMKSINHILSPSSLLFTPSKSIPPHCTNFIVLPFIINF
jgi:hypothetical protein